MKQIGYRVYHEERTVRILPAMNKVINFKHGKKTLNGKVVMTNSKTDSFEVESNGTRFLVSEWMGNFVSVTIIRARKF